MKYRIIFSRTFQICVKSFQIFAALLGILAWQYSIQAQTLKADYQFQGNLNSTVAGAPAMANLTGSSANSFQTDAVDGYARQSLRFPFNSGLSVTTSGIIPNNAYTIVMLYRPDETSGFRRIAGFDNGTTDNGAYSQDGRLEFENTANTVFFPNTYIQVVIVREASGRVRAYRDGGFRVDVPNDGGAFQITANALRFFQDDTLAPTEASAGNVARIRLYDAPMTSEQVQALDRLPQAAVSPSSVIAFGSSRDGNGEIYVSNADGSNQIRITNNPAADATPSWSSDGKLLFDSFRDGNSEIYTMNADGSNQTRITNNSARDVDADWFPDSSKIAFCSFRDNANAGEIYVMNANGTNQINLTQNNTADDLLPAVSPDGQKIVFTTNRDGNYEIYTMNVNGTNLIRLTNTAAIEQQPAWSPNGQKIAFVSIRDGNEEIYIMNADGSNQTNLSNNTAYEFKPSFSPDGAKIVFQSGRNGGINVGEIYTMNVDGTNQTRLTTNSAHEVRPDWKPQAIVAPRRTPFDFDGDGKADISVFRPDNGAWYIQQSANGFTGVNFGLGTDKLVPADYDGDGKTDIAVNRNGVWYLQRSLLGFTGITFGDGSDIPQPADFDGDGKAEIAVWRPSNGTWYVLNLVNNQFNALAFGAGTDKPVAGDYDGDGKADYAVFRPSNGSWYLQRSQLGFTGAAFGDANDKCVPADYDGDGKTDIAVFRPSNGSWYLLQSTAGFTGIAFGFGTDLPAAADYDGDGKADVAVFRNGTWYLNRSTAGFTGVAFGALTDKPVPNVFVP